VVRARHDLQTEAERFIPFIPVFKKKH